jgi:hypothetical protein
MTYCVLAYLLSLLLDLGTLGRRDAREQELEILLLLPPAGRGEPDLGLPPYPRGAGQAGLSRRTLDHPRGTPAPSGASCPRAQAPTSTWRSFLRHYRHQFLATDFIYGGHPRAADPLLRARRGPRSPVAQSILTAYDEAIVQSPEWSQIWLRASLASTPKARTAVLWPVPRQSPANTSLP